MTGKVFPITAPSTALFWTVLAIITLLLTLAALFGFMAYGIKKVKFTLTDQGLRIRGGLYGRFIPRDALMGEGARVLNLNLEEAYRPRMKINGITLPGYREGWFKLRNGEKALLFVTDWSKVAYVPTREGYSLILSTSQPESLLRAINGLR